MSVYWLLFSFTVLFSLSPVRVEPNLRKILFFLFGLVLAILIGFRNEVGGGGIRYVTSAYGVDEGAIFPDDSYIFRGDYGYRVIHWISVQYLYGIYSTNFISAFFFTLGLIRFCRTMPLPWTAIAVSVPYMVIIIAMGYTRQSVALGFLMWGLVDLLNGKEKRYYAALLLGSFFHMTVLIMLPVAAIYYKNKVAIYVSFAITLILLYIFWAQISHMFYYYVTIEYHKSSGAIMRVFMTFVSAILFMIYRQEFKKMFTDERMWFIFSVISIFLFLAVFYYSTLVDRVAIYFIPLQLVVFSRIPILIQSKYYRTVFLTVVVMLYASSLFVWLYYGTHASHWLPYGNILFSG